MTMIFAGMLVMGAPFFASLAFLFFISIITISTDAAFGKRQVKESKKKYGFIAGESVFNNSILVLAAAVIRADRKQTESELKYVEAALKLHFSPKRVV